MCLLLTYIHDIPRASWGQTEFPHRTPNVSLQNASGLGNDEASLLAHAIDDWLDEHFPYNEEEGEVPSCLTLVESVLDTLDQINQTQRCSICLLPLLSSESLGSTVLAARTPCGHVYDFECLSTWWVQHEQDMKASQSTVCD